MTTEKVITSPVGTILFSTLRTPKKNDYKGTMEYSVRLEIDADAKGSEDFKKALKKINKNLLVEDEDKVSKEGNYIINARTKNVPTVFDKDNTTLPANEVPMIQSGTAKLLLTAFEGKSGKGGGINLAGVQLLDIVEFQGTDGSISEDALRSALQAKHS